MNKQLISEQELAGINICVFPSVTSTAEHIISARLNDFNNAIAINPEKVIRMEKDKKLHAAIKSASINYPDGIGICIALGRRASKKVTRIPGCELWEELMRCSGEREIPVFILGGSKDVNSQTVDKLRNELNVEVVDFSDGYFDCDQTMINRIQESGAQIISVAMGSPKQEIFIEKCRQAGLVGFFMGVGGTYDVFTGSNKRAPIFFRKVGLEWFYRLLRQPQRILRQRNLVKFALLVASGRI